MFFVKYAEASYRQATTKVGLRTLNSGQFRAEAGSSHLAHNLF